MANLAAIYGRQSSDEQGFSRELQIARCRQLAAQLGDLDIPDELIFFDKHQSGAVYSRPDYDRCKAQAQAGRFNVLLLYALDRLGRGDPFDTIYELRYFRQLGIRVFCEADRNEATSQDEIDLLRTVLGAIQANKEMARIRKRTIDGRLAAWEKDNQRAVYGGQLPLGWARDKDKHLVHDPHEMPLVHQIFDMVTEQGLNFSEIEDRLNKGGIQSAHVSRGHRKGARWSASMIRRVLTRYEYVSGVLHFEVADGDGGKRHITVEAPPIVDAIQFRAAQDILGRRQRIRKRKYDYLLKGALRCGECGDAYVCTMVSKHRPGYVCRGRHYGARWPQRCDTSPRIPADAIDPIIWRDLVAFVHRPDLLEEALYTESIQQLRAIADRLVEVERQIEGKQRARQRLATDFAMATFSEGEIRQTARQLAGEIDALEREHYELSVSRVLLEQHEAHMAHIDILADIDLDRLPPQARAELAFRLVDHVDVAPLDGGAEITVNYRLFDTGLISGQLCTQFPTYEATPQVVYY